jgi:hypothetical protein
MGPSCHTLLQALECADLRSATTGPVAAAELAVLTEYVQTVNGQRVQDSPESNAASPEPTQEAFAANENGGERKSSGVMSSGGSGGGSRRESGASDTSSKGKSVRRRSSTGNQVGSRESGKGRTIEKEAEADKDKQNEKAEKKKSDKKEKTKPTSATKPSDPQHDKPFTCEYPRCHKGFSATFALRRHERIHTGEKAFKCDTCAKTFSRKDALKQHVRIHERAKEREAEAENG